MSTFPSLLSGNLASKVTGPCLSGPGISFVVCPELWWYYFSGGSTVFGEYPETRTDNQTKDPGYPELKDLITVKLLYVWFV
jgi:hypothetical protein